MKAATIAAAALVPIAMAAVTVSAAAPSVTASPAQVGLAAYAQPFKTGATATYGQDYDDLEPAGGTGIDPGPQTAPDTAGIPDQAGVPDSSSFGERAGGTGIDPGLSAPPDTPSGPGLNDGGEPAGAIG